MIDVQQVEMTQGAPPERQLVGSVILMKRTCPAAPGDAEVVVCGRKDKDQFRISAIPPPPPADDILSLPLRVQLAPGVSFGFQRGGGFGLRTEFGPGKKSGE